MFVVEVTEMVTLIGLSVSYVEILATWLYIFDKNFSGNIVSTSSTNSAHPAKKF